MPQPFRFGLVAASAPSHRVWVSIARRAEELGYSTLLIPDRTSGGTLAPLPALALAASVTSSLRIGSYVFCNGYRHPVLLAEKPPRSICSPMAALNLAWGQAFPQLSLNRWGFRLPVLALVSVNLRKPFR